MILPLYRLFWQNDREWPIICTPFKPDAFWRPYAFRIRIQNFGAKKNIFGAEKNIGARKNIFGAKKNIFGAKKNICYH